MPTQMMGWNGHGGWSMMILWWVVIIAAIVVPIFILTGKPRGRNHNKERSALDVLKKRYAEGAISKHEFEEKKKDIS